MPLNGDAGSRRYYRLSSQPNFMLVDAPPAQEKNLQYVQVSEYLSTMGIRVPHIYAVDFEVGRFINEDLGDALLQHQLTADNADHLYQKALAMLLRAQSGHERPEWALDYSAEMLADEMQLFSDWFIEKLLGMPLSSGDKKTIEKMFAQLIDSALQQPQVFVHRDFHCRNLMLLQDGELATIDFQDAVWGPITYDLVSICKDCYLRWPEAKIDQMVNYYAGKLAQAGLLDAEQAEHFPRWSDWMGLQRHIKVLGIFARLHLRDNKPDYLHDLPLVLRYTLETLAKYPEFSEFNNWMLNEVLPRVEKQSWYTNWKVAGTLLSF